MRTATMVPPEEGIRQLDAQLSEHERHFNTTQSNYRLMSSTWLLATRTVGRRFMWRVVWFPLLCAARRQP